MSSCLLVRAGRCKVAQLSHGRHRPRDLASVPTFAASEWRWLRHRPPRRDEQPPSGTTSGRLDLRLSPIPPINSTSWGHLLHRIIACCTAVSHETDRERDAERDEPANPLCTTSGGGLQNRRSQVRALSPLSAAVTEIPGILAFRRRRVDRQPRERDRSTGSRGMPHSSPAKAAVIGLTRALARELGATGHPRQRHRARLHRHRGRERDRRPAASDVGATPLGRVAEPGDTVGTLLYLLGPGAAFVSGQVVLVNGGRVAG
jgi:hypothetical protein